MKISQSRKTKPPILGKDLFDQVVYESNQPDSVTLLESKMNPHIITILSILGLGALAFLAHKITRVAAPKTILVEQRQILYRRRP